MKNKNKKLSRRGFLNKSLSVGSAAVMGSTGVFSMLNSQQAIAQSSTDYKALVYVFMAGGNDANNMIVPTGEGALRQRYDNSRGIVALAEDSLHPLALKQPAKVYGGSTSDEFGLHPSCSDMAEMFNQGELSFICNTGNLVEPTTREQFENKTVSLPPQLFSHADQQKQYQSEPTNPFRYGWGGRLAELTSTYNTDGFVSPLISTSGLNSFQVTKHSLINPFVMSKTGVTNLNGFNGARKTMMERYFARADDRTSLMGKKYQQTFTSARHAQQVLTTAFDIANNTGVNFDSIFEQAGATDSSVGKQLKTVAKLIAGKSSTTNNRPVYFVKMGGFDTHKNILADHQVLMSELNNGLKAFRDSLKAQGDFDKVLTFSGSEFGRTLTPNKTDSSAGTDHAWGGHAMLMGGMVNGGHFFGEHPDLQVGQGLDSDSKRGRWIPTTSTSQVSAVISHWFGVDKADLTTIFPSLVNFNDPFDESSNLELFKAGEIA
jgi:uncharacterized protein (DUF1501 family)